MTTTIVMRKAAEKTNSASRKAISILKKDSLIFGNFINLNLLEKKNHTWIILTKRKKTENVEKSRISTTIQSNKQKIRNCENDYKLPKGDLH